MICFGIPYKPSVGRQIRPNRKFLVSKHIFSLFSATFLKKVANSKCTKLNLRRLIDKTKAGSGKHQPDGAGATSVKKIDSSLAKYTDSGQLSCAFCLVPAVREAHVNSKHHKETIERAKKQQFKPQPIAKSDPSPAPAASIKRPSSPGP
uniref:(northern house mosquito) hypothetical protein n=1 Tax=Culex pipiens TaxID=7175 RepID=A0A8D8CIB3_CULPI